MQSRADRYWKIGITLPNVDMAVAQLRGRGVEVSEPKQFQDIGYMSHLADPAGYQIELLQHDFESNRPVDAGDRDAVLGGGARVAQVTLRTNDLAGALAMARGYTMAKRSSSAAVKAACGASSRTWARSSCSCFSIAVRFCSFFSLSWFS